MLPIKAWRVYYADGSTFDSTQGTWAEAPPFGVQCIVWYHEPPRKTLDGGLDDGDVYVMEGEADVKMGLWMGTEGYYRIHDLARRSTMPEV